MRIDLLALILLFTKTKTMVVPFKHLFDLYFQEIVRRVKKVIIHRGRGRKATTSVLTGGGEPHTRGTRVLNIT
jgi:hypothetical protein